MSSDNIIKTTIGLFAIIVIGTLCAALLGGFFGAAVALISPEFVTNLFTLSATQGVVRYSFAVGMIWGLFIGGAASGFACFLASVIKILRIRFEYRGKEAH